MQDQIPPKYETIRKDGYEVTLYPGFVRRLTTERDGEEIELYEQTEVFHLPEGETRTHPQHEFHFRGGKDRRDFTLGISDPKHQIARIIVELFPEGHEPGAESAEAANETVTIEDFKVVCPPYCEPKMPDRGKVPPPRKPKRG